jgi:hypothetical protein
MQILYNPTARDMADGTETIFVAGLPTQIVTPSRNILSYRPRVAGWAQHLL